MHTCSPWTKKSVIDRFLQLRFLPLRATACHSVAIGGQLSTKPRQCRSGIATDIGVY